MKKLLFIIFALVFLTFGSVQAGEWYNFKTEKHEYFEQQPPDDRLPDFLPQEPALQVIYQIYIEMGSSPIEAYLESIKIYMEAITEELNKTTI